MADFLVNCKQKYSCDETPRLPFDGEDSGNQEYAGTSFAPFIELKFILNNELITVGNKSRPGKGNTAVIKSMEYGASEGMGVTLEIFDEEGGNFTKSFDMINKGLGELGKEISGFELDFGWIIEKSCGDLPNIQKLTVKGIHGHPISLLPIKMNVIYEGGKIKYVLEAQDLISRVGEVRHECNIGTDDKKVSLKDAIRIFMKEHLPPPMIDVEFTKQDGTEWNFSNSDGGPNGPKSVWPTCQQNKLATLRRWIAPLRTESGKGILFQWKGTAKKEQPPVEGGTLILLEDPTPDRCQQDINLCNNNIATYIINGGNESPVLSFNPSVNWTFAASASAGGGSSPNSGDAAKQDGKTNCPGDPGTAGGKDAAGIGTAPVADSGTSNWRAGEQQAKENAESNTAHQEANAARELLSPIEAELKIIGDPKYVFPVEVLSKQISLLVINPYHLRETDVNGCPSWLAEPVCNPVFSNKGWTIMGVNHQIREGSYVTTLKLMLPVPNVQLPPNSNLGGDPNGYKVEIKTKEKKCEE